MPTQKTTTLERHGRARLRVAHFDRAGGLPPRRYDRQRELPLLLPLLAGDLEMSAPGAQARLLALLGRALRAERARGQAGHWSYDVARHAALLRAFQCERANALDQAE